MARTNVLTTARRIRRQLGTGNRQEQGVLFATIDNDDIEIKFTSTVLPKGVQAGTILGVELELMRVTSINSAASTCQVIRAYHDSEAVAHSAGALIDIAPRFSLFDVLDAMISELDSWSPDLYRTVTTAYTVASAAVTQELDAASADAYGVVEALQSESDGDSSVWPRIRYKLIRTDAGSTPAPTSGLLLRFLEPIRTGSVVITLAVPFDVDLMDSTHDLVTDVGLSLSMIDVLELGARVRLIMGNDDMRTGRSAQDEPRRAEETAVGSTVTLSQLRLARYTRRKSDEIGKLRRRFPIRQA